MVKKLMAVIVALSMAVSFSFGSLAAENMTEEVTTAVTGELATEGPTTEETIPEEGTTDEETSQPAENEEDVSQPEDEQEEPTFDGVMSYIFSIVLLILAFPLSFLGIPLSVFLIWFPPLAGAMFMLPVGVIDGIGKQIVYLMEYLNS